MKGSMKRIALISVIWSVIMMWGCEQPQKRAVAPPDVTVAHPMEREVTRYIEYTGNTQALEYVDIRARVAGFLESIKFEPRQKVKTGDLLFVIDPRQYQAAVDEGKATVEAKKAQLKLAKIDEEIAKSLEAKQAISWLKMQEAEARSGVTQGDVGVAEASLAQAKLNLEYTQVASPINGRVSRNLVDVGNLVGATEKTLLTTVVNDESIYCYFNLSELDLLTLRRMHVKSASVSIKDAKIPAYLGLADEEGYPHQGMVDFVDTQVNQATGTIQCRGIFPNPDYLLLHGLFARIRVPVEKQKRLLVPDVAVQFDQGGRYLLVINDQDVVQQKRIKMDQQVESMRVVEEGVTAQDRVIITGVQRARPGGKVNPKPAEKAPAKSEASAPAKPSDK